MDTQSIIDIFLKWETYLAFFLGIILKIIIDEISSPAVEIETIVTSYTCDLDLSTSYFKKFKDSVLQSVNDLVSTSPEQIEAYRVRVKNKEKIVMNAPARNCVVWLDLDNSTESYQLSWIGGASITINVGDHRDIDFSAVVKKYGIVIAPTENGYSSSPRLIGGPNSRTMGWLRVTSENAKSAKKRVTIVSNQDRNSLDISFKS